MARRGTTLRKLQGLVGLAVASLTLALALAPPAAASDGTFERAFGWNVNGGGAFENCTVAASCLAGTAGGLGGEMNGANGIATDGTGNIFVADTLNNRFQMFDFGTGSIAFISASGKNVNASAPGPNFTHCLPPDICQAGTADGTGGAMNQPEAIAAYPHDNGVVPVGSVYVADTANNRIEVYDLVFGDFQFAFGDDVNADVPGADLCGPATSTNCKAGVAGGGAGAMNAPNGIAVDDAGNVYVADTGNHRVQRFDQFGTWQRAWGKGVDATAAGNGFEICTAASGHTCQAGTPGGQGGEMNFPTGVGVAPGPGGIVYVADQSNNRIQGFDQLGNWVIAWGKDVNATAPTTGFELCTAASGDLCKAGVVGTGDGEMSVPFGVAADGNSNVYVADTGNNRIQRFSPAGILTWGSAGTLGGEFSAPTGIASDATGTVLVADAGNNRIQVFGTQAGPLPPPADVTPIAAPIVGSAPPFVAPTGLQAAARHRCKRKHRARRGSDKQKQRKKLRKCRKRANRLPV